MKGIIGLLVAIIVIVAVALPTTIETMKTVTRPVGVVNETLSTTNASCATLAHYPIDLTVANRPQLTNTTGVALTEGSSPLTANYTLQGVTTGVSANGTICFINVKSPGYGSALVSYSYQASGYDTSSTDRLILNILPLALVVMLLVMIFMAIGGAGMIG